MPSDRTGIAVHWDGDEPLMNIPNLRVVVTVERCKGCGLCVAVCPPAVLTLGGLNARGYTAVVLTDNERCTSCAVCALVCPECALDVYKSPRAVRKEAA